jgi:hypothetical protein
MKFLFALVVVCLVNFLDVYSTYTLMPNLEYESNYLVNLYQLNFFQFALLLIFGQSFVVLCLVYYFFVKVQFEIIPQFDFKKTNVENSIKFFKINFLRGFSNKIVLRCLKFISFYYPILYVFLKILWSFSNYFAALMLDCCQKIVTINKHSTFYYDIHKLKYPKPINDLIVFVFYKITESDVYYFIANSSIFYFSFAIVLFFVFLRREMYLSLKCLSEF